MIVIPPALHSWPTLLWMGKFFLMFSICGCSREAPVATLEGTVSYQGQPLPQGAIMLFPIEGTTGTGGNAKITEGRFEIPPQYRLFAGTYSVSITSVRGTGRKAPIADMPGEYEDVEEQFLPDHYNSHTILTIQLQPGKNTDDFQLH